jgi:hypothetical protein
VVVQIEQRKSQKYDRIREACKATLEKCQPIVQWLKNLVDQAGGPIQSVITRCTI